MKYLLLLLVFSVLRVEANGAFSQFGSRDWSQRINKYRNTHRQYPENKPKEIKPAVNDDKTPVSPPKK